MLRRAICGRANDFTQCVLFRRRARRSFALSHSSAYNGAFQDQSSSHLSAVLEIPDRYSTARPRFVRGPSVRVCVRHSCICKNVHSAPFLLSQIFTLDFLIFAEAMMRESHVSRDDYSEWSREEVPPGGANSTVRDCSASISSSAILQPRPLSESSFCLGFCPARCLLFWHASWSIEKFIRDVVAERRR